MNMETPIDGDGGNAPTLPAPIIVKKITIAGDGGHHGGAWKVAYADFVTAMMAFFLLLWLLGATTEDQRKGLADHFAPTLVKTKQETSGADGMLGGSSITDADSYPNRAGQTGNDAITVPRAAAGGPEKDASSSAETAEAKRRLIRERIIKGLAASEKMKRLIKQVRVMRTPEGIRIDLVDDADFSMFALGTTVLVPDARDLLGVIATTLDDSGGNLIVRGHTDALGWKPGVRINNWSLSTGRAEATRQELLRQGLVERRFTRIEGVADRELLVTDDPTDPRNRRISILVVD